MFRELNSESSSNKVVSHTVGYNISPTITGNNKGEIFIAWHTNLKPDLTVDFTPWLALRKYENGNFGKTYSLASDSDWEKIGEDQGLEFPTIVSDLNDNLWLFSRPTQGFRFQIINGMKKSPLYKFNLDGWGGRGQYVRAVAIGDKIFTVKRDIRNIYQSVLTDGGIDKSDWLDLTAYSDKKEQLNLSQDESKVIIEKLRSETDEKIIFGDIHQHSSLSDGIGTVDQCFTRSKYKFNYDFAALTDHEWFTRNLILPSEWAWINIIGNYFDEAGKFSAISAYEWTSPRIPKGYGHKNVYFKEWNRDIYSLHRNSKKSAVDLFDYLETIGAVAFPHHIGWTGIDWENHREGVQSDIEIVSAHGAFEYMGNEPITHRGGIPGNFVQDGLKAGYRFGFIGSSDGHGMKWHHCIARKKNEWQTGLTGIYVNKNNRSEIFKALKRRNVFATSGEKIKLSFSISGIQMGDVGEVTGYPEINFEVIATGKIKYVILVRNNENILYVGKDFYEGRGVRKKFVDENITEGENFYYLRVLTEDDEMAWSSPIWINHLNN